MNKIAFFWLTLIITIGISASCIVVSIEKVGDTINNSKVEVVEPAAAEVASASKYDVSYLEAWCGEPYGTVRMLAGWYHSPDTIETEDNNLWTLNTDSIEEWDLLLIWFDTMGTPEIDDDQIIKVWKEVYN